MSYQKPYPPPRPPGHLFRVVKILSTATSSTGTYLCLPRDLPTSFEPTDEIDESLSERCAPIHTAFKTMTDNARLQQQLPLLEFKKLGDVLYHNIKANAASALRKKQLKMLPQLMVVKTSWQKDRVRSEVEAIEEVHRRGGNIATLHVGSWIMRSQHTFKPETSFMVLRPVFGPTLEQCGEAICRGKSSGIPSWLVAHICIGLMDTVGFLQEHDIVHGNIKSSNVMLNLYPVYMHYRYRGYPDVQLIGFSACRPMTDEDVVPDFPGALRVMEEVITKWSDAVSGLKSTKGVPDGNREEQGRQALLLAQIRGVASAASNGSLYGQDLQAALLASAENIRYEGPQTIPRDIMRLLHADLATAEELKLAVRDPVILKFRDKVEGLRGIIEDTPVAMGGLGYAGMKTQRIMVIRFRDKKLEFLRAVGEEDAEGSTDEELMKGRHRRASL